MKTIGGRFRAAVLMGAAASVLAFAAGAKAQNRNDNWWPDGNRWWNGNGESNGNSAPSDNPWPYNKRSASPVLAVVGDVACEPDADFETGEAANETCDTPKAPYTSTTSNPPGSTVGYSLWLSQEATANQIESMKPDAVALLGDLQYQVGEYQDFEKSYDLTFGGFKKITRPAPGNHEFYDEHSETGVAGYGYFSYFNGFQIDGSGNPIMVTLGDPCPSSQTGCGYPASSAPVAQPIPRSDGQAGHFEQTGGVQTAKYANGPMMGNRPSRSRRWLVLLQSGRLAPDLAQYRVRDAAGRLQLFQRHLACRRNRMAEKRSRRESFRVHTRLLAPAHLQRCRRPHRRGHHRWNLVANALRRRSRPGAERTRPPLCPLRPD